MTYSYLMLLRYLLINAVAIALTIEAALQGWVRLVFESDVTYMSVGICGVFVIGLVVCTIRVWRTSREINLAKSFDPETPSRAAEHVAAVRGKDAGGRAILADSLRFKLFSRIAYIRHIANNLVVLGLIGTVVGFIIALSGVDPDIATNPSAVSPMVARLIEGMSVALFTTLVGAILSVWLMLSYQILATGTTTLVTTIVELGESIATASLPAASEAAPKKPAAATAAV